MVISFVAMGSILAPRVYLDRSFAAALAYFLGLGVGVHALDQLEPAGSHYVNLLSRSNLKGLAIAGLLCALALGSYYAVTLAPLLVLFVGAELFFALAYPLPSYVVGGRLHNNLSFVFSWGFLPCLTGYYINALTLTPQALFLGMVTAGASWIEIALSRDARNARSLGLPKESYGGPEVGLKILVLAVCSLALGLTLLRAI